MNALVNKEVRMLAPGAAVALILASLVLLVQPSSWSTSEFKTALGWFLLILFPVLAGILGLVPFAGEVSAGTFSNLLSQPISRSRVWWIKASLSAASLGVVLGAWWLCYLAGAWGQGILGAPDIFFSTTFFFMCAVYSGGLWSVLLLRQAAVAFWCTVLVPCALLLATSEALKNRPEWITPAWAVVLAIYSIAGFWWARWMFLRAQDVPWTGGTISFPFLSGASKSQDRHAAAHRRRPRAALFLKELQLHHSQLVVTGVLLLAHLGVLSSKSLAGSESTPTIEFVHAHFWVIWLAMPLVVGSAAMAEERRLGTMHAELCLPVGRFTPLATKLSVVLALSVLLGVGMPVLLEGPRILWDDRSPNPAWPPEQFPGLRGGGGVALIWELGRAAAVFISEWQPFLVMAALASGLGLISFCTSSLSRTTLQALAGAVVGVAISGVILAVAVEARSNSGILIFLIGTPVLTLTIGRLLYLNSRVLEVGGREWRRNVFAVLGALAFVWAATSAIHHRAWELAGALETPHGPSRVPRMPPVTIRSHGFVTTIVLGDGRAWTTRLSLPPASLEAMILGNWKIGNAPGHSQFLEGTNWAAVVRSNTDAVGIQKDGSLWVSEKEDHPQWMSSSSFAWKPAPIRLARFGSDSDWKNAAITSLEALVLKTNGTLWRLGTNRLVRPQSWPGLSAFEPVPVAPTLSWSQIFTVGWRIHFTEADGSVWGLGPDNFLRSATTRIEIDSGRVIERAPYIAKENWLGLVWVIARRGPPFQVGVHSDGTFRVNAAWEISSTAHPQRELARQDFRFGNDSDWTGIAGDESSVVTLKSDGSLWRWRFPDDPHEPLTGATASRLGSHSDWVAVAESVGGILSLAADGGLYYWPLRNRAEINSDFGREKVCSSRRVERSGF